MNFLPPPSLHFRRVVQVGVVCLLATLSAVVFVAADNDGNLPPAVDSTAIGAPGKTTARKTQTAQTAPGRTQTTRTERPSTQSKSHQGGKQYGHGHSRGGGVGFGVDATIDLSGIGQRRPEPNPFAVPAGPQPVTARTEKKEKPRPKRPREVAKPDPFANVSLTGPQAKAESDPHQ